MFQVKLERSTNLDILMERKRIPTSENISFGSYITVDKMFNDLVPIPELIRAAELWITSEHDPQLSDVEMFFSFIKTLTLKNDIESLNFIVEKVDR